MTLAKQKIRVNRGATKKTIQTKGLGHISKLILLNLEDTLKILEWNVENDILVYRMSSDSFSHMDMYEFEDLPNFELIKSKLKLIGDFIKENKILTEYE